MFFLAANLFCWQPFSTSSRPFSFFSNAVSFVCLNSSLFFCSSSQRERALLSLYRLCRVKWVLSASFLSDSRRPLYEEIKKELLFTLHSLSHVWDSAKGNRMVGMKRGANAQVTALPFRWNPLLGSSLFPTPTDAAVDFLSSVASVIRTASTLPGFSRVTSPFSLLY